jgi:hypothetical protein
MTTLTNAERDICAACHKPIGDTPSATVDGDRMHLDCAAEDQGDASWCLDPDMGAQ